MNWTWLGHSTFLLENEAGTRLITDPVDEKTGYAFAPVRADVVTVSHRHHDHCALERVTGERIVKETCTAETLAGFAIKGYFSYHDEARGRLRGTNVIFAIEADGQRFVHCGDLGHVPDDDTIAAIKGCDVLFVPVGGVYTIDGKIAWALTKRIAPKTVVPMHFLTPVLSFKLDPVDVFLSAAKSDPAQVVIELPALRS